MAAAKSSGRKPRNAEAGAKGAQARGASAAQVRGEGLTALTEQMANRIIKPLGLVVVSRERIRETLDEAAEQGRITRRDAEDLFLTLVQLGREQTDHLLVDLERVLGRGRQQLDSATRRARTAEPVDRLVRRADRARRSMRVGPSFPIIGYDDLTAGQVQKRLNGLSAPELRKVRDYEQRHGNRKSVLSAIDKALD